MLQDIGDKVVFDENYQPVEGVVKEIPKQQSEINQKQKELTMACSILLEEFSILFFKGILSSVQCVENFKPCHFI